LILFKLSKVEILRMRDSNQVIRDFWPYESNPRYESFEKR
jgi:hypothetical protein